MAPHNLGGFMTEENINCIIDLIESRKQEEIKKLKSGGWDSRKDAYCDGATQVCDDVLSMLRAFRIVEEYNTKRIYQQ